jgi:hypothetical protein
MRKGLIVLLVAAVAVAFALPAMADLTPKNLNVSGFYRAKSWVSNFQGVAGSGAASLAQDPATAAYVEQRARVKFDFGTENVKAVWFLESDMNFGDSASIVNRNQGGALSGDSIQIETKNLYLWFKVPDTSLDFTVGLQNQSDPYAGVIYGAADMAGIFMTAKFEPVMFKLGWAKLYENQLVKTDDATLYVVETNFLPGKAISLGLNFMYLQDDTGAASGVGVKLNPLNDGTPGPASILANRKVDLYTPGLNATFKLGPATLSGFGFYQIGTAESLIPGVADIDIEAYGADLRADLKLGPANIFLEGIYLSGDDKAGEYNAPITLGDYQGTGTGSGGNSGYTRTRMQILLASWDTINSAQCLVGCSGGVYGDSLGLQGRGLWHAALGANVDVAKRIKLEANVGYAEAVKMLTTDPAFKDKDLGAEVNAGINFNIAKGLDFGLFGAYVFLGDFNLATATSDPEDLWQGYARLNYAF